MSRDVKARLDFCRSQPESECARTHYGGACTLWSEALPQPSRMSWLRCLSPCEAQLCCVGCCRLTDKAVRTCVPHRR